jgi:iron(III) transport system substrate-binding protein
MLKKWILFCLVGFVSVGLVSCKKGPDASAKKVVLYCSVDQVVAEPIVAEFEKLSGIKVDVRYDIEASKTVGLVQKIRAESSAPVADVFWSSEIFHTIALAGEGILKSYNGESTKNWPANFADAEGRWYGFALRGRVIAYNTNRVTAADAPKLLEQCLSHKWKGRVVMATPKFGTTGGDVASWFANYGPDRAVKFLEFLAINEIRLASGNSTAVKMVADGRADICFTDTDDVYAAQRNGWPVKMNPLNQGANGSLTIPNTAAVIKGGPNPTEAAALMEFLLSEKLEIMLAESDSHNSPIHADLQERFKEYAIERPLAA